jgi:tetratricopeptide (TPR) repeat protein
MEKLWEWIQKFWSVPIFIIGAITELSQFVELWRGARDTITWSTATVGLLLVIVAAGYVSFSKVESSIVRAHTSRRFLPRFPKLYIPARLSLVVILISALFAGFILRKQDLALQDKLVILVTNFDGPDTQTYRVTDIVLENLKNIVNQYDDTVVVSINKSFTENDSSESVQKIGKQYRADLVIWGWYGVSDTDVILTVHVENLAKTSSSLQFSGSSYMMQNHVEELKSFQFQQQLSERMISLTLFVGGIFRFEAGDYNDAVSRFLQARDLAIWPEEISSKEVLFTYLGDAYLHLIKYEDALNAYSLATDISPNNPMNHVNMCNAFTALNRFEDAFKSCNKAIEIVPLIPDAYIQRSILYLNTGDLSNALSDSNNEIDNFPNNALSYNHRGYILYIKNDISGAISDAETALRLEPDNLMYLRNVNAMNKLLGKPVDCLAMAKKLLRGSSTPYDRADAYAYRASCYDDLGRTEEALSDRDTAIKLDPKNSDYYFSRGYYYDTNNQIDKALLDYNKAIELDPTRSDTYINRGILFLNKHQDQNALRDFQMAVKQQPQVVRGWYMLGVTYDKLSQYNNAVLAYTEAIDLNAISNKLNGGINLGETYYYRGMATLKLGNTVSAVNDFKAAYASDDLDETIKSEVIKQLEKLNETP